MLCSSLADQHNQHISELMRARSDAFQVLMQASCSKGNLVAFDWHKSNTNCCSSAVSLGRGDGFQFDQLAFVASQGRNDKAQTFLRLFRHSQLYEVFINERLKLASQDYKTDDNFESKVCCSCTKPSLSACVPPSSLAYAIAVQHIHHSPLSDKVCTELRHIQPLAPL